MPDHAGLQTAGPWDRSGDLGLRWGAAVGVPVAGALAPGRLRLWYPGGRGGALFVVAEVDMAFSRGRGCGYGGQW